MVLPLRSVQGRESAVDVQVGDVAEGRGGPIFDGACGVVQLVFEDAGSVWQTTAWVYRQLVLAHAQILEDIDEQAIMDLSKSGQVEPYMLAPLCAAVEIADFMNSPRIAAHIYEPLAWATERGGLFSSGGWTFLLPRILGVAAAIQKVARHFAV